jgi:hypothetical protein
MKCTLAYQINWYTRDGMELPGCLSHGTRKITIRFNPIQFLILSSISASAEVSYSHYMLLLLLLLPPPPPPPPPPLK